LRRTLHRSVRYSAFCAYHQATTKTFCNKHGERQPSYYQHSKFRAKNFSVVYLIVSGNLNAGSKTHQMTERQKIKDYNLMLQKYIDKKAFVKLYRTVCNKEENLSGFILGMSKDFLFLQLDSDFMLDGYAIIRLYDFDGLRLSSYERTQRKIFKAEGILDTSYGFDRPVPLTSWTGILKTLKSYDLHVIVENINKDCLDFWIGEIKTVRDKSVSIHNYNPDGQLDDKPKNIKLDTISIIKFGDRYSTVFRKYVKQKKK